MSHLIKIIIVFMLFGVVGGIEARGEVQYYETR